jgi:hypothetical protein
MGITDVLSLCVDCCFSSRRRAQADEAKVEKEKYSKERESLLQQIEAKEAELEQQKQQKRENLQKDLQASLAHLSAQHAQEVLLTLGHRCDETDMDKLLDAIRPFYPEGVTADETAALFAVVGGDRSVPEDEDSDEVVNVETDATGETVSAASRGSDKPKSLAEALRLSSVPQSAFPEITAKFACESDMCKPLVDNVCEAAVGSKACEQISKIDCGSVHAVPAELIELRRRQKEVTDKYNDADAIIREFQEAERKSWGEDDIWFSLRDKCVDYSDNKYKYNVCLFKTAKQDRTSLGSFHEIARDDATGELTFKFTHGERCFVTNRPRTMDMEVVCGADTALMSVEEPDTCAYKATLKSPVACT